MRAPGYLMRILVVSDLHGDLEPCRRAHLFVRPDLLLSCGDWGDPDQVTESDLAAFPGIRARLFDIRQSRPARPPCSTCESAMDRRCCWPRGHPGVRGSPAGGDRRHLGQVAREASLRDRCRRRQRPRGSPSAGPVDILLTHGCPIGLADLTPTGRHGGQRCFLDAFKTIKPRLHLCGHLHVAQERTLKDGRR